MRSRRLCVFACGIAVTAGTTSVVAQDPFRPGAIDFDEAIQAAEEIAEAILQPAAEAEATDVESEIAPGELHASVALAEDAARGRQLRQATRLVEMSRYDDAALALGRLAESIGEDDVFVRVGDERQSLESLKNAIQEQIGRLPEAGREAYEISFGRAARRMLDDAGHDPAAVQRIASIYLHTQAGAEALYRLAAIYRDRGAFPEAAACLERLRTQRSDVADRFEPALSVQLAACRLESGDAPGALAALESLSDRQPNATVSLGGEDVSIRESVASAKAGKETLFGKQARTERNPPAGDREPSADAALPATGLPFPIARWSRELLPSSSGRPMDRPGDLPVLFPTVVGDLVLLPTGHGFAACDRRSGEWLWTYPADDAPEPTEAAIWKHRAGGRLSTDGRTVFLVEADSTEHVAGLVSDPNAAFLFPINGMAVQQQMAFAQAMPWPNGFDSESTSGAVPVAGNQLTALDVSPPRQGNRLWTVGGAGGVEPRLAGHRFLGRPLTAYGRLYAIAEFRGTVKLVVLDAATGRCDWMLNLGQSEIPLSADPHRLEIGATPSFAQGILICPTGGGAVVAVDLAGRSLRWGYRYPRSQPPGEYVIDQVGGPAPAGWCDETVHIVGDRILLTPPESEHLYCLDLFRGEFLWQQSRGDRLFVAHADEDRILLVGSTGLSTLDGKQGAPVGAVVPFPEGAKPAGRGVGIAGRYLQPLTGGQLAIVDVDDGSLSLRENSHWGTSCGNLAWYDGVFYSVGHDFLRAFDDEGRRAAEIEQRLAAVPDDAQALLMRASQHTVNGRHSAAIDDCRRAYRIAPGPRSRNALVAALLDGVRHDLPDADRYDAELAELALAARKRSGSAP